MIKILLIGILLLKLCLTAFSQQPQRIVTGTVTDAETGEPVQSATVFIANTTVGITTDADGNYRLYVPGVGSYEIVVSHVAYEPVVHKIDNPRTMARFDVELVVSAFDEIIVKAKSFYRKEDVKLFWDRILDAQPSSKLKIENLNDIHFFYNASEKTLRVICNVPIRIVNNETGYKIHYTLINFYHNYTNEYTRWSGNALFEELIPINEKQQELWEKNRSAIYHLSLNHFIQALYNDKLQEKGFLLNYSVFGNISAPLNGNELLSTDSIPDSKVFHVNTGKMGYRLLLSSFGRHVTTDDIRRQARVYNNSRIFNRRDAMFNYLASISNEGTIRIFPDGTYVGSLEVIPHINSPAISGVKNMLPIEFAWQYETNLNNHEWDLPSALHFPEKIYLSTDRSMYAAGDTVWISAWVLNAATLEPTDKSRMLHLELIRPDGTILRHLILETLNGLAFGQIVLPTSIIDDALFRLRAYTRWSLNFDESYRFERQIPIMQFRDDVWQGPTITEREGFEWVQRANGSWIWRRKSVDVENVGNNEQQNEILPPLDLQFLPESGRWVTGLPSHMAFKAIAEDGLGVNIEGEIFNDLNEKMADFQSLHNGMGSVFLVPQPGRSYHARLFSGHTVDLPMPDTTGIVMTIQHLNNDTLTLQLYFSLDIVQRGEPFYLAVCSRGAHIDAFEVTPLRTRMTMQLFADDFQTGIARFTLLTKDGIPCNERLIFIDKDDQIKLQFSSSKESDAINLQLQANDAWDNPLHGIFTVSVTDSLYGSHDARNACLRSQMLLSSDLKGKIENPGWYFQDRDSLRLQALDLVMKTHGWSGYSWDDIRNIENMELQYEPELDYSISGTVTNLRGAPARDASVTLLAQGAVVIANDTLTDRQGRFRFDNLLPFENTLVSIIAKHQRGRRNALGLGVELYEQPVTPSPPVEDLPESGGREAWEELLAMYRMQRQNDESWLDSLMKITDVNIIEELIVQGVRPVRGSWNLNGPGHADYVLFEEDIARYDDYDRLLDIFRAEFPQFHQENWQNDELLNVINQPSIPENIFMKIISQPYPIWRFENRTILFILNGRVLPAGIPAEDNFDLRPHPVNDSIQQIATKFWNIPAHEITGIEILDSSGYLWAYFVHHPIINFYNEHLFNLHKEYRESIDDYLKIYDSPTRPILVQVTTESGSVNLERFRIGMTYQRLRGFTVPKTFYIPKYYPEDIVSQAEYDIRPTLYWNPEVVTDRDGKAEIRFPIGEKPRSLQIRIEGTDLRGGIGSAVGELIIDN